ncbi:MAG: hypothetical protein MUF01_13985 [Bryobacterales bacterium]|nr:hypothetical protein [Bryobacterales bacterium]
MNDWKLERGDWAGNARKLVRWSQANSANEGPKRVPTARTTTENTSGNAEVRCTVWLDNLKTRRKQLIEGRLSAKVAAKVTEAVKILDDYFGKDMWWQNQSAVASEQRWKDHQANCARKMVEWSKRDLGNPKRLPAACSEDAADDEESQHSIWLNNFKFKIKAAEGSVEGLPPSLQEATEVLNQHYGEAVWRADRRLKRQLQATGEASGQVRRVTPPVPHALGDASEGEPVRCAT